MNYARVAPWYQPLSRLIFGNTLIRAQRIALDTVSPGSRLLIAGGGDGEILKYLREWSGPIDFVEISPEMLRLARRKGSENVRWLQQDIFNFRPDQPYDIILFPFLLDNFLPEEAEKLIARLSSFLREKAQVIIIDYTETPAFGQKILLRAMYLFFRIAADVRVKALPPIEKIMQANGFHKTRSMHLYGGFVEIKHYHM